LPGKADKPSVLMQYMGSKNRIAKHILPYIYDYSFQCRNYVEPFVGGCNMIDEVAPNIGMPCIGADGNSYLIAMWKALQDGWDPPRKVSREHWRSCKEAPEFYPPEEVAFVGLACSFGARWFEGYASNKVNCNYAATSRRVLNKQMSKLAKVDFIESDYKDLYIPPNSLIYCDPPYKGTGQYAVNFNHEQFYDKCVDWVIEGHTVLVSEYSAPEYFNKLLEIPHFSSMSRRSNAVKRTENLYLVNSL